MNKLPESNKKKQLKNNKLKEKTKIKVSKRVLQP